LRERGDYPTATIPLYGQFYETTKASRPPADIRKCIRQRNLKIGEPLESLNRETGVSFIGIRASAEVVDSYGSLPSSLSLFRRSLGIESDSDDSLSESVEKDELATLRLAKSSDSLLGR